MISSLTEEGDIHSMVSAGVLVEKGQERRLTSSWHNWENQAAKFPGKFERIDDDAEAQKIFRASQGVTADGHAGTTVGFVVKRMGPTDIALLQLEPGVAFDNTFMEVEASPKKLCRSEETRVGDLFFIDSYATALQQLMGLGKRAALSRPRRAVAHPELYAPAGHHDKLPPDNITYIRIKHGVYSMEAPVIKSKPQIRGSACGSVLLRYKDMKKHMADVLKDGEIFGMMHLTDLQQKHRESTGNASAFLVYADSFDPLIEDGWAIAN